jgi:ferredoxin
MKIMGGVDMGFTIYYFSATGNSLEIARKIAKELGDCKIKPIAAQVTAEPVGGPGEAVGFIFPVFYNGLPRLVKRFAERLAINPGTYCFAVANSGGTRANPLGMLEDILSGKGICLSYAEEVKMPGNYIVGHQVPSSEKVRQILDAAARKVDKAVRAIAGGEWKPVIRKAELWSRITNHSYLYKNINEWDEEFFTTGKCTGCSLCAEVCPVCNIKMEDRRPVWQHSCERCLACIHWCPCEAIEYGKKTVGRRRYHNPNIKIEDIKRECACENI